MSRRDYPRFGQAGKYPEGSQRKCGASGCTSRADGWVRIQFTWMRGEDEFVDTCIDHSRDAHKDTKAFCKRFPPEAWKE